MMKGKFTLLLLSKVLVRRGMQFPLGGGFGGLRVGGSHGETSERGSEKERER